MVPQSTDLREEILKEFYFSRFAVHPGGTKMYHDLRQTRWEFCSSMSHVLVSKG